MLRRRVIVHDFHGLRFRPAAKIAMACRGIDSKITISKGKVFANGNSIMELLLLDAGRGSALEIMADGNEEETAIRKIFDLF